MMIHDISHSNESRYAVNMVITLRLNRQTE